VSDRPVLVQTITVFWPSFWPQLRMVRNRLHLGFIDRLGSRRVEGRACRHHPILCSLRGTVAGAGLDAGCIDGLLRLTAERYAFEFRARSAARFLRFSVGSALPTITSFASASCCIRRATSSRIALQVLSTRHGFFSFGKSHWLSLLVLGGGGGGFSTVTCDEESLSSRGNRCRSRSL